MSLFDRKGGLLVPLLLFITGFPVLLYSESILFFISARNNLFYEGRNVKDSILKSETNNILIVEYIGISYSRLYIKNGYSIDSTNIEVEDAGSNKSLMDFLDLAMRYTDNKINLVVWDHGNGWYNNINTMAISYDNSTNNSIGVANGELYSIFNSFYGKHKRKFKTILFDACLMGEIEVIYELSDFTDYLIASPDKVPIITFNYHSLCSGNDYYQSLENNVNIYNDNNPSKFSIIDINKFNRFLSTLKNNVAIFRGIDISSIYTDLKYYTDSNDDSIACGIYSLLNCIDSMNILDDYKKSIVNIDDTVDISMFIPVSIDLYLKKIYEYKDLRFNKFLRWDSIAFSMYNETDTFPPMLRVSEISNVSGNTYRAELCQCYDFASDVYGEVYNYKNLRTLKLYDFEDNILPNSNGFTRSLGESYNGEYSYFSKEGDITIIPGVKRVYIGFYIYKYNANINLQMFLNGHVIESGFNYINDFKWRYVSIFDTIGLDSIKISISSTNGWAYIDDIVIDSFSNREYLGRKSTDKYIFLYNLFKGDYNIAIKGVDTYGNYDLESEIYKFTNTSQASAYIWPSHANTGVLRHIAIDDSSGIVDIKVFAINGKRIIIDFDLDNRAFIMPDYSKNGIYVCVAITEHYIYNAKFIISH